jgi:hypothetical protein
MEPLRRRMGEPFEQAAPVQKCRVRCSRYHENIKLASRLNSKPKDATKFASRMGKPSRQPALSRHWRASVLRAQDGCPPGDTGTRTPAEKVTHVQWALDAGSLEMATSSLVGEFGQCRMSTGNGISSSVGRNLTMALENL